MVLPKDVVRVDRLSKWGNPFKIGDPDPANPNRAMTRSDAIGHFRDYAKSRYRLEAEWLAGLEGKKLACWCAPEDCHAQVLLDLLENRGLTGSRTIA